MARFEYFFRETTSGLRRNGLVAFAAISTTFIALLLFGIFHVRRPEADAGSRTRASATAG